MKRPLRLSSRDMLGIML